MNVDPLEDKSYNVMEKYKIKHFTKKVSKHLLSKYKLCLDGYKNKYGFGLSEIEIAQVYGHIQALEDFMLSKHKSALVCTTVQNPDIVYNFDISENDWNFISLKQETPFKYMPQQGYVLEYKWSDVNYLVSQDGCRIILERVKVIDKPYCDIILELIHNGELTGFVFEDDGFNLNNHALGYDDCRNQEILTTIMNKNRWSNHDREKVRELLRITFSEAKFLDIDLFINEGTLLGGIRHGQIMPWDDDLDLGINKDDIQRLLKQLEKNENIEMGTAYLYGKHLFYKIWLRDCKEIKGHKHRFPFIDIWPFEIDDLQVRYDFGYQYHVADIFPLIDYFFENTYVKIPANSISYLDNRYPDWKEKIVFYPYCHSEERTFEKLLEAYISVDKTGLIKP